LNLSNVKDHPQLGFHVGEESHFKDYATWKRCLTSIGKEEIFMAQDIEVWQNQYYFKSIYRINKSD